SKNFYNVRIRFNSTTRNADYTRKLDLVNIIKAYITYLDKTNCNLEVRQVFYRHLSVDLNSLLLSTAGSKEVFSEAITQLQNIDDLGKFVRGSKSWVHIIQYFLLGHPSILRRMLNIYYKNSLKNIPG